MVIGKVRKCLVHYLNTCFQFLNNIICIFTFFFYIHIFLHIFKYIFSIFKLMYQTPSNALLVTETVTRVLIYRDVTSY